MIDSLPEQVYVKDTEGHYVLSNLARARALGASSPEETVGKTDFDFYPRELAERYRDDEREVIHSERPLIDWGEPGADEGATRGGTRPPRCPCGTPAARPWGSWA